MNGGFIEKGKMTELDQSNLKIFLVVAGMTSTLFGLLIIFLDYVLDLNPSIGWVGAIMFVVGIGGIFWK